MSKLSIITINLNNKDGLQKTIDSVMAQTSKCFEWIVIDGASTDGSRELVEKYSAYVTYWLCEPDTGIYNAMNKGVDAANGDYLLFLNSGDCLYDENVVRDFLERDNTEDLIYGNALVVDDAFNEISKIISPAVLRLSTFWSNSLNHQSIFFHERCFKNYRYSEEYKIASDYELIIKLLLGGYSFHKYDRFIAKYNGLGASSTSSRSDEEKAIIRNRLLPSYLKQDYEEIVMFRDVDLAVMIKGIIKAKRIYRNITRLFLYPLYILFVGKLHRKEGL